MVTRVPSLKYVPKADSRYIIIQVTVYLAYRELAYLGFLHCLETLVPNHSYLIQATLLNPD